MPNKLQKIQYIILIIIAILIISFVYFAPKANNIANNNQNIWVNMVPIQCLGNPWEFDWLKKNKNKYSKYPIGHPTKIDLQEIDIIEQFYKNQGINILDIKSNLIEKNTCAACSCAQGYKLHVLVSKNNVDKMIKMGWKE